MLTVKKARELLNAGDTVFVVVNGGLQDAIICAIEPLGIDTDIDFLPYDEHGLSWWLTKRIAVQQLQSRQLAPSAAQDTTTL